MPMKRTIQLLTLFFACTGHWACFVNYEDRIHIDGSSTLFPLSEAVAEDFRKENPSIKVTVGVSGTSGGLRKFIRSEIDIADASRKMNELEKKECLKYGVQYIELPVSGDGIVIAVHPENNFVDYLTVAELKKIWEPKAQQKIKYWDQVRNTWPHKKIELFGAGTSSGSFDFFTQTIIGIKKASRGDYTASEDDNMLVQGVSGDKGSLGFFGFSYYKENAAKLKIVPIDDENDANGIGPISPTVESIRNRSYQPLSRTEYIYVNKKSAEKASVQTFVRYYLNNAEKLILEIGGVPLTEQDYKKAKDTFETSIKK